MPQDVGFVYGVVALGLIWVQGFRLGLVFMFDLLATRWSFR